MKNLNLTIKERAMLADILPPQGNKLQQIIVRALARKVEFSSEEIDKYKITFSSQGMSWSPEAKDETFDFLIPEAELSVLKETSAALDKEGKITQFNLSLIEKIDTL